MSLPAYLFSFRGRSWRRTYWYVVLPALPISVLITMLLRTTGLTDLVEPWPRFDPTWIIFTILTAGVTVRRGHDRGRPTLWTILATWSLAAIFVAQSGEGPGLFEGPFPMALALVWWLYIIIDYGALPGAKDWNAYGDPPGTVSREPGHGRIVE